MNKEMIVPVRTIGNVRGKLEYLDRLTRLHGFLDNTDNRIDRLCNSIEKDLGLIEPEDDGYVSIMDEVHAYKIEKLLVDDADAIEELKAKGRCVDCGQLLPNHMRGCGIPGLFPKVGNE